MLATLLRFLSRPFCRHVWTTAPLGAWQGPVGGIRRPAYQQCSRCGKVRAVIVIPLGGS